MKIPHRQRAAFLYLLLALAIVGVGVIAAMHSEGRERQAAMRVRHTLSVETTLIKLLSILRGAQSDERGYLLTQDETFLEPYEPISRQVDTEIENLRDLVADNPEQQQFIERFVPLVNERLQLMRGRTQVAREGHFADAIASVKARRGNELMDQISAILNSMTQEEDRLYQQREQAYLSASESLEIIFGFLFLSVAGSGLFVLLTSEKHLLALETANEKLKRAYEEIVEQSRQRVQIEAQLRQAQKLEALGHLTGGIAHDFNNMLSIIVASLNIMRRRLRPGDDNLEALVDSAEDGANKATRLVRRLLTFAREQPLDPKVLDPNEQIAGMCDIWRQTLGSKVEVETHLPPDLWQTCIDAHELENALLNLAVNGRDAMPQGGRLAINTENVSVDDSYVAQNPGVNPGQYVKISVTDTGEGMPPEVAARAFDPFFTTKPAGKGTGLGLSQVHGFVKQSNGHIKIYSEPGRGTCISILFPRFLGDARAAASQKDAPLPLGRPEEVLLIVDDDATARSLTALAAKELGYSVFEADGGEAALGFLKAHSEIALLVTDVVMSEMDGAQLTREAVFRRHDLRVLYMTGFPRAVLLRQNIQNENVLTKPFTLLQFATALRLALNAPGTESHAQQ